MATPGIVGTLITKSLEGQKIEPKVIRYIASTVNVALNVLLVVGIPRNAFLIPNFKRGS